MKADDNKPIDSNQLHKTSSDGTDIPIRRPSAPAQDTSRPNETKTAETATSQPVATEPKPQATPTEDAPADITPTEATSTTPAESTAPATPTINSPGLLVLQWLTYAFWGWTNLVLIWLTYIVATYLVGGSAHTFTSAPYVLAAAIVLLPLSVICDWFYSRREPAKKTGAATILMIVHTVIFALFGIGALITFAFSLVRYMLVPPSDLTEVYALMISSIIIAGLYAAVFLRTLNPKAQKRAGTWLSLLMGLVVIVLAVINVTGPIKTQRLVEQDEQTAQQLTTLVASIDNYVKTNRQLPASLQESSFPGSTNPLVNRRAVQYHPQPVSTAPVTQPAITEQRLAYTLCVTYQTDTLHTNSYESLSDPAVPHPSDGFWASQYHQAGNTCYQLYSRLTPATLQQY